MSWSLIALAGAAMFLIGMLASLSINRKADKSLLNQWARLTLRDKGIALCMIIGPIISLLAYAGLWLQR